MTDDADDRADENGSTVPHDLLARLAFGERESRVDDHLEALAHRRRRLVLYYLRRRERATLDALARWIVAVEEGVTESQVPADACDRVVVDLFHAQLPKLADAKIVEYDRRSCAIRYRDPPATVERLLETCAALEFDEP